MDLESFRVANIVLLLIQEDVVAARRTFNQFNEDPNYINSDDYLLSQMLISSFENNDEKLLQECQDTRQIVHLNNYLGKLVLSLHLPELEDTSSSSDDLR